MTPQCMFILHVYSSKNWKLLHVYQLLVMCVYSCGTFSNLRSEYFIRAEFTDITPKFVEIFFVGLRPTPCYSPTVRVFTPPCGTRGA